MMPTGWERLSAQDASFLHFERRAMPMHVAAVGLGVGVLSYDGRLDFGLVADRDVVPDLARLADAIPAAFGELVEVVAGG
jgi:hypothetical protein